MDVNNMEISSWSGSILRDLPTELLDLVLSFLPPKDLDTVAYSSRYLYIRATHDRFWQPFVQDNVPGYSLETSRPCSSYHSLYRAHDPHWFVSKGKIWAGDQHLFGRVMITYYNTYRGTIDGFRLVAERGLTVEYPWDHDQEVNISSFNPNVRLHTDVPLLRLEPVKKTGNSSPTTGRDPLRLDFETPMPLDDPADIITQSTFMLTKPATTYPQSSVWPPTTIPADQRVINLGDETLVGHQHVSALVQKMMYNTSFTGAQKPRNREQICEQAFRIRQYLHTIPGRRGEPTQINTYAALDPALYTPTATRPFRGIWVANL
jgi:hypothetical protein